jgi:predicted dehydrogenase
MAKKFGVGIVGLGWVSAQYIKSFSRNRNCEITALCTRDNQKGKNIITKYGLERCEIYNDLAAMLKGPEIDIVCILTPNFLHVDQAMQSAEAGKSIVIEKPIALNWSEAKVLNDALERHGSKNIVGFVLRWNSLFKNIRAMIDRGMVGEIFHVEIDYMFHLDKSLSCYDWCSKKRLGGSVLIQSGCHAVDGLCYFSGQRATEVLAVSSKNRTDFDHDTTYMIVLRFGDGTTGKIFCTYDTRNPYVYDIQIYGNRGSIRNDTLYSKHYFQGQTGWIRIPSIMPDTEDVENHPFPELVDYYVDCLIKGEEPHPSVKDVMHVFEIIEAAERSAAKGGTVVKVPFE